VGKNDDDDDDDDDDENPTAAVSRRIVMAPRCSCYVTLHSKKRIEVDSRRHPDSEEMRCAW